MDGWIDGEMDVGDVEREEGREVGIILCYIVSVLIP